MKPQKQISFIKYKLEILKKLMEICLITDTEALLTIVTPENKFIIFSSTKNSKIFTEKYLVKNNICNILEKYNLKDVTIYLIFVV